MTARLDRVALLAVPGLGFLALVYALPLVLLLLKSLRTADGLSVSQYAAFFADDYNMGVL